MHLFQLPEVKERYILKKRNVTKPDLSMLKEEQRVAFDGLKKYILDDSGVIGSAVLIGYAGTGKTFIISKLIEEIFSLMNEQKNYGYKIACTATTNKAVKVTYRQADYFHTGIDYKTVHSLLGLKEQITNDGKQIFVQDYKNPPQLDEYQLLIVDEASMLDVNLFIGGDKMKGLQDYIEEGLKVIFVGDDSQIPPINRDKSPVFDEEVRENYNIKCFKLTEIVRQAAENPIISIATEVRNKLHVPKNFAGREHSLWEGDKGVYFIDRHDQEGMDEFSNLIEHIFCSENFKADPDFGKIIAYHRSVVAGANNIIRRFLYGDDADEYRIMVGEKLLVNSPIFEPGEDKIMLPTNEEIEVVSFNEKIKNINEGMFTIPYYETRIKYYRFDNSEVEKWIRIPTTEGQRVVNEILEQFATRAKAFGKTLEGRKAWSDYFEFQREWADVSYNYSITAHRSQGSTYQNAIVLEYDIDKNRKIKERQRIKYTAFTRPSQRLFIIN